MPSDARTDSTAMLAVTVAYLVALLSIPLSAPDKVVWMAVYPIVQSELSGIGYGRVMLKSLWVLPLIVAIGIFNPFIDTETAFTVGGMAVNRGWVSLVSIVLRGLFAFQAVIILTLSAGVYDICSSLRKMGCPAVLSNQILFTYRYINVVMEEALNMDRARKSRGFGEKHYPMKMWGRMIGQLLVRSMDRASRIHRAMLARGFDGTIPTYSTSNPKIKRGAVLWTIVWIAVILLLRLVSVSSLFATILPIMNL